MNDADTPHPVPESEGSTPRLPAIIESRDLLRGFTHILIRHDGQMYTLRRTKENKLILTK